MSDDDDDGSGESRRQIARRQRRNAGDQSASIANRLMKLPDSVVGNLGLDEELRDAIARARAVTSPIARRRAERTLAGDLRGVDLDALETAIANVQATGAAEPRLFHLAEQWRARLIEEGIAAAAGFPGGTADPLPTLIHQARRERDTGKPPGAARALFRHVLAVLKAQHAGTAAAATAATDARNDDDD